MSAVADPPSASPAANVAKFGGIMALSLLLSRVLGMARDTVMISQFGFGLPTDAYQIAARIPDMIFMLIAGGGLSSAFIPIFSELIHTKREREAWRVFSIVVSTCAVIATVLIAIAWLSAPWIVDFFRDRKPVEVLPEAIRMSRIMLPAQFAFLIGSVMLATLYARKQFIAPGLAPNVYNVGIILGALLLPAMLGMGIESMAWGALVGAIAGNLLLPAWAMMRAGSRFEVCFDVKNPDVRRFFALLLPVILGFSLPSMVNIITQKFASAYGGEGVNTVLGLANNLMQAPLGIFGQALALAAFPVLAEFFAKGEMDRYRDQVSKTLRTVIFLGSFSGAIMLALAPQIVNVLYGWGRGHQASELAATADCLRIYSVAIFAWCMQPVLMRGFFSLQKTLKPIAIGTAMTGVFIALCVVATRTSADFRWLPWATNVAAAALAVALFFGLESEVGKIDRKGVVETILKSLVAAVAATSVAFLGSQITPAGKLFQAAGLLFWGLVGFWVFFYTGRALKMPETAYLDRLLSGRRRRG